jgi:lipoprotein-anchoring transpeptidase ErfK/SrfK
MRLSSLSLSAIAALSFGLWTAPALLPPVSAPAIAQTDHISGWITDLRNSSQRWILVDLSTQRLTAWEGNNPVYSVIISSGRAGERTPTGVFWVQAMYPTSRMQGDGYDIPDVPYAMYYYGNYAIHGTYWHNDFGIPVSNGCINVAVNHAEWLYYWASLGTTVVVRD